jgi:hypothetical protein
MKHLALLFAATSAALAQSPADRAVSTTQSPAGKFRTTLPGASLRNVDMRAAPELFPGELEDVGPQYLLARRQEADGKTAAEPGPHRWFEAFADWQFFYTNNALLTEKDHRDTGVMVITLQAAINFPVVPLWGGQLATKAGYRHQWWMYSLDKSSSGLNNFDFSVATVFFAGRHSWDEKWVASFTIDYNRYLSHDDDYSEFYVELAPAWALERNFQLDEKTLLTAGYYGSYHWTQTDPNPVEHINDRLDTSLGLTLTRELIPNLIAQAYYRFQLSHYTENSDRNDAYHSLGLAFVYNFNEWASVRTFLGYENRNSTDDLVADYNKFDAGGGLTFTARF